MVTVEQLKGVMSRVSELMVKNKEELIQLDSELGDGDLGLTMVKAFRGAEEFLNGSATADVGLALVQTGFHIAKVAPSTMGTLVASGFMRGGKAVKDKTDIDAKDIASFFAGFVEGVMDRGKSKPGEKTLIDVLLPVAEAVRRADADDAKTLFQQAYETGRAALDKTTDMMAQHGRAAYYREKSIGKQDAGATAALLIVQGFKEYFEIDET